MPKAHLVSQKLYISNFSLKQKKKKYINYEYPIKRFNVIKEFGYIH